MSTPVQPAQPLVLNLNQLTLPELESSLAFSNLLLSTVDSVAQLFILEQSLVLFSMIDLFLTLLPNHDQFFPLLCMSDINWVLRRPDAQSNINCQLLRPEAQLG